MPKTIQFVLFINGKRTSTIGSIKEISQISGLNANCLRSRWRHLRNGHHMRVFEIPVLIDSVYDDENYMNNVSNMAFKTVTSLGTTGHKDKKDYAIYNSDDEIVFVGKAKECAKRLNCKVNNVYEQVLLQKKKHKPRKYYIMKIEEEYENASN